MLLIDRASVSVLDIDGNTMLHYASMNTSIESASKVERNPTLRRTHTIVVHVIEVISLMAWCSKGCNAKKVSFVPENTLPQNDRSLLPILLNHRGTALWWLRVDLKLFLLGADANATNDRGETIYHVVGRALDAPVYGNKVGGQSCISADVFLEACRGLRMGMGPSRS